LADAFLMMYQTAAVGIFTNIGAFGGFCHGKPVSIERVHSDDFGIEKARKRRNIILPEGAYNVDINYFTDCASYNEEEHTITIDQKKIVGRHKICNFSFSIPAEKLAANPRIVAWFEATFINGKDYTSIPCEQNLRVSGVELGGPNSVCYDDLTAQGGYPLTVKSQLYGQGKTISIYDGDTLLVYQAMPSAQLTFDLPLTKDIGTHELRVVVSDGTVEDETVKEVDVVYDDQPVIDSVYVTCNGTGGMLVGKGSENFNPHYSHRLENRVSVRVQAQHSELIEKMWAVVSLSKGSVKINLTKKNDDGMTGSMRAVRYAAPRKIPSPALR
jgi:hypothetical protein